MVRCMSGSGSIRNRVFTQGSSFRRWSVILLVVVVVLMSSCVSTQAAEEPAAPTVQNGHTVDGAASIWRDDPTSREITYLPLNIHFPRKLEHLVFSETTMYDENGLDVSVSYNSPDLPLWLTFYIYLRSYYPHPDVSSHFESCVHDIMTEWPGSEVVNFTNVDFQFAGVPARGLMALVHYGKGPSAGEWGGYAVLFPYGDYYLYMRLSFRGLDDETTILEARLLMEDLLVTLRLPPPESFS